MFFGRIPIQFFVLSFSLFAQWRWHPIAYLSLLVLSTMVWYMAKKWHILFFPYYFNIPFVMRKHSPSPRNYSNKKRAREIHTTGKKEKVWYSHFLLCFLRHMCVIVVSSHTEILYLNVAFLAVFSQHLQSHDDREKIYITLRVSTIFTNTQTRLHTRYQSY